MHVAGLRARRPVVRIPLNNVTGYIVWTGADVICDGIGFSGLESHFQMNLVSNSTSMTVGCAFTDVVMNDILTSTSKNMTVTEDGQ